jgi:hypothetical protein
MYLQIPRYENFLLLHTCWLRRVYLNPDFGRPSITSPVNSVGRVIGS